jgi:methylamine--corrinoid protein Co-methyltransferase
LQHVAAGVTRVVKEYDLRFDQTTLIQRDDALIGRLWEAALDFLETCGVYNTSTGRRMLFTRREIEEWVAAAPSEAVIGEGRDARTEVHRSVEDPRPPIIIGGPIGVPLSEDMFVPIMQSYIQEPIVDTVTVGCLDSTHGREIARGCRSGACRSPSPKSDICRRSAGAGIAPSIGMRLRCLAR